MTARKDLKKRIRDRQAKTGESYSTARMHVLGSRDTSGNNDEAKHITAVVLKCNEKSLRVRVPGQEEMITLRTSSWDAHRVAPGQFIETTLEKQWDWNDDSYASGTIERFWTDVPALKLDPLPLKDEGIYDLKNHEPFERPDPYFEMWEFFASTPRGGFEFDGIAWGAGVGCNPDDHETCLVATASELIYSTQARDLLMQALYADIRCIDAHVHLGNLQFDLNPKQALVHYDTAVRIGDLSLGEDFDGMLPWGLLYNRPYLRALHGYGLCMWRLEEPRKALDAFEYILRLNPPDNQGVRFCWHDMQQGLPWTPDEEGYSYSNATV